MDAIAPDRQSARLQFSLAALFEYTAVCAVLAACKPLIGAVAAAVLMCIPPALAIGNGLVVLALYFIACGAAEGLGDTTAIATVQRLLLLFALTLALCIWVQRRRGAMRPTEPTGRLH